MPGLKSVSENVDVIPVVSSPVVFNTNEESKLNADDIMINDILGGIPVENITHLESDKLNIVLNKIDMMVL